MARHAPPARIYCVSPQVSGTDIISATATASAPPSGEFVLARNVWGGIPTAAISDIHDPTHPWYLWGRTALFASIQSQNAWTASERSGWITRWTSFHADNPLCHIVLHNFPMHNIPGFRNRAREKYGAITDWALNQSEIARNEVLLGTDSTSLTRINANRQTATTSPLKQAGWNLRITNPICQDWLSDMTLDVLAGTNETGHNMGGGDVSNFMFNHHDGSDIINPKSGSSLRNIIATGNLVSVLASNSQQPTEIRIDASVTFNSSGSADGYLTTTANHPVWILPSGNEGFVGFHVRGYLPASGGRTDLLLKDLSITANPTQHFTVTAGMRYCLNTNDSGNSNSDWNNDGDAENAFSVGQFEWADGWDAYWDQLDAKMQAARGHGTGRGWNSAGGGHVVKRTQGLPHPHGQTQKADWIQGESIQGNGRFEATPADEPHNYTASTWDPERHMRAISFAADFIRPVATTGYMQGRVRAAMCESQVWGSSYSDINSLDANFLRFHLACNKFIQVATEPQFIGLLSSPEEGYNRPVAIEECFLDLDTGYTNQSPIGSYDPEGGPTGSAGYPEGSWTWNAPDAGERIYIRRFGSWIIAANLADVPSGYGTFYKPSHLAGGYVPRNTEDRITQAQMDATGLLSGGETLSHFNPATYVNQRATDAYVARSPSVWTGFSYGPRQAHPADSANRTGSTYTLSNSLWMARDNTKNDGSAVSFPYDLGPLEAVFWEIS